MGEMVKFGGSPGTGLMAREDLARSLNNVTMAAPRVGGDKDFLRMEKSGDWVYGQEETVVEGGSHWAVNPQSFEWGYIAWPPEEAADRSPEGEVMVPITRPLPAQGMLRTRHADGETTGAGWQYQQSVDLQCVSGEDEGTTVQYKQSSVGSQKAFKSLTDAISSQIAKGSDAIVPVIELKSDSYKHKKWGKIHNPIFEVVEWRTMDGEPDAAAAPADPPAARMPRGETRIVSVSETSESVEDLIPDDAEEAALAKEYEAEQAAASATPRRRVRR